MGEFETLQILMNRLQGDFHQAGYLSSDPLEFVHQYEDPWDQEAVALVAALLAYGNVKQIRKSVSDALTRMKALGASPGGFVRKLGDPRFVPRAEKAFGSFVHRFNRGPDLVLLFKLLARSWKLHGSLGAHFLTRLDPGAQDIAPALDGLMSDWTAWAQTEKPASSFFYLLTAPRDGSCCKRWCMLLRWMGRKDEIDPGLWAARSPLAGTFPSGRALRPDQLVIPLDTHTGRISQYLGLTERKSLGWKAAVEVTESLRKVDPRDPVRYDFSLARLGILDLCQRRYRPEICSKCQLYGACRLAKKKNEVHAR